MNIQKTKYTHWDAPIEVRMCVWTVQASEVDALEQAYNATPITACVLLFNSCIHIDYGMQVHIHSTLAIYTSHIST